MFESVASKVIFCDGMAIRTTPNGIEKSVIGFMTELRPINVPGNFTFTVHIVISNFDSSVENNVGIAFFSPDEKIVMKADDMMIPPAKDRNNSTAELDIDCRNVPLLSEGVYRLDLFFNGELINQEKILVKKVMYDE